MTKTSSILKGKKTAGNVAWKSVGEAPKKDIGGAGDRRWRRTVVNVPAVASPKRYSSRLITWTITGVRTGEKSGQKAAASPFISGWNITTIQRVFRFCVIIAIMPNIGEFARTRRR